MSNDKHFKDKLEDIVSLYLDQPEQQALQAQRRDDVFAAKSTLDGNVLGQCMKKHQHQEWLLFLRQIYRNSPRTSSFT